MKNIRSNIIAAGILCLSLGMTSCTKGFLDVESKTESTTGNFYKTEQDAYRALLGCYDGYRRATCGSAVNFLVSAEVMGYECFGGSGASDGNGMRVTDRFDLSEMPSSTGSSWSGYYAGIYRCNELITRENSIQWNETGSMYNPKNEKTVLEKRKRKVRPGRRKNENGKFPDTHKKKDSV